MKSPTKPAKSDLKDIFQSVVEAAHHITALPVSIWTLDKTGTALRIAAFVGLPESYVKKAFLRLDEVSVTGDVFRYQRPEVVSDINEETRWKYKDDAKKLSWKSMVCVPIITEGVTVGVLSAYAYTDRRLSDIRDSLSEYASLVALNILAVRRRKALEKLLQLGARMQFVAKSPKTVLDLIARDACDVTGADCAVIYPYDSEQKEFYKVDHVAHFGLKTKLKLSDRPRSEKGMAAYVRREKEITISDIEKDDPQMHNSPFIKREGIKAFMGIALRAENIDVGVLYVDFSTTHIFTDEEKEFVRLFAQQASIVVLNTRLYEQAVEKASDLEKIQKAGAKLVSLPRTNENLRTILKRIVKDTQKVLGADLVDLYQYYENTDEYELPPVQVGKRNAPRVKKEKIEKDDVIWSIVKGKQPLYILNSQDNKDLNTPFEEERTQSELPTQRFVIREDIKSTAAVPLIVGEEVVGALFANYRTSQVFLSQHTNLIELYATQAAIAIHNFRLYSESLQRSKRLELVRKVASAVSSATDIKSILQFAVNGLAKVFDVKQSAVALFDDAGEYARAWVEYLEPGCVSAMGHKIPLKNNPQIDKILETKQPLIVDDVPNDPIMVQTRVIMTERKTLSLMVVPIIIDDKVVGTIGVDEVVKKRHFTKEDAELAQAIADQAGTALRIAQQLEKRVGDINALQDITEQSLHGDLNAVLNLIAERAIELTGAKHGGVWLVNKTRKALVFGGHANKEQYKKLPPNISLDNNSENSFSKWVVLNKQSYLSDDVSKDANYKSWYEDTRSELTVPIIYQDQVIGTINVESPIENSFTKDHKRLLEAMAGQAAIVVQNARLLEQLERRVNALDTLNDIGRELTSRIHLKEEEILESILKTGAQDMYVALYNEESGEIRFPLATEKGKRVEYTTRKANMKKRGKTEEIIFTRKSILHKTKKEAEEWYRQPGHAEFVGLINPSWLGVPMMVGERVLGVLAIYDLEQERAYDEQDLQVFSSMASQAAIALDNATLYYNVNQQLESANQQLETVFKILNAVEIHGDLHQFLQHALEDLLGHVHAQNGTVQLYDSKRNELMIWAKVGNIINPKYQHISLETGLTGKVAREKRAIYVPDVKGSAEYVNYISNTRSEFASPMLIGDTLIGVLNVEDPATNAFSSYNRQLIERLGNQLAILVRQKLIMQGLEEKRLTSQVNESLGLVTAEVAHKVGNAAGKIRYLARERLQNAPNINESQNKDVQIILRNVEDMIKATDDLFKPFGMEPKVDITIEEMIRVAIGQCATPKNIKIVTWFESNLPKVNVQVTKVQSYLAELLNNAIKYTIKGITGKKVNSEKIEVVGKRNDDGFVEIHITNHGPAIPPEQWESIFIVFSARGQKSEDDQSYGLGLWGARATMQQQGGDVLLLESDDAKTTFVVRLFPSLVK